MKSRTIKHWGWLIMIPLLLGTTYILKERGVETGRIVEDDGKGEIIIVEGNAVTTTPPAPAAAAQSFLGGIGRKAPKAAP